MSNPSKVLLLLLLPLLFSAIAKPVLASDDSNSGDFNPIPSAQPPSQSNTNATDTIAAIDKLSHGLNDTALNSLVDRLKNDVHNGNNTDATETIRELQSYVTSSQGTGLSPSLKDLIQSLTIGPNGLSVDPSLLQSLLGDPNQNGIPAGLAGMDPALAAGDLSSLSNLMKGIDPTAALSLAQESQQIQDLLSLGGSPKGTGGIPTPPPIQLNAPNGGGFVSQLPKISPGVGSGFQLGKIDLTIIAPFIIAAVAVALLILRRSSIARWSRRITPSSPKKLGKPEKPDAGLNLRNARDLVIFYFRKTVAAMHKRGVPRLVFETHREFSAKCSPRPEAQPFGQVASLYEKAMFSGREVTQADVDGAKESTSLVEGMQPGKPATGSNESSTVA